MSLKEMHRALAHRGRCLSDLARSEINAAISDPAVRQH